MVNLIGAEDRKLVERWTVPLEDFPFEQIYQSLGYRPRQLTPFLIHPMCEFRAGFGRER